MLTALPELRRVAELDVESEAVQERNVKSQETSAKSRQLSAGHFGDVTGKRTRK